MNLFDTHFHCDELDTTIENYIKECEDSNVRYLLASGFDLESSRISRQFCENAPHSWFSAGIHPHNVENFHGDMCDFREMSEDSKFIAVGEIGLDYFYMNSDRHKQISVFERFLVFSLERSFPAVIHCRSAQNDSMAHEDAYAILSDFTKSGGKFLLHCYCGELNWTEKFISLGAYFGISGMITFPKADNIRETARILPLDRILIETDAPYLAPAPYRGKKNRSSYLIKTAERLAITIDVPLDEIARTTTENAFRLFRIPANE